MFTDFTSNVIEVYFKDKFYVGYILNMEAVMNESITILDDEFCAPIFYKLTLLPYDINLKIYRKNERVTVIINNLSEIKQYEEI